MMVWSKQGAGEKRDDKGRLKRYGGEGGGGDRGFLELKRKKPERCWEGADAVQTERRFYLTWEEGNSTGGGTAQHF